MLVLLHFLWCSQAQLAHAAIFTGGSGDGWDNADAGAGLIMYRGSAHDGWDIIEGTDEGIGYGSVASVAFTTHPSTTMAGQVFSPQPVVKIYDENNNVVLNATNFVSLSILNNPSNGTLGGTTSMNAVAGVADFTGKGLFINNVGQLYTLKAESSGLTDAISNAFDIVAEGIGGSYSVKSDVTYDASSGNYLINSWLEAPGVVASDAG